MMVAVVVGLVAGLAITQKSAATPIVPSAPRLNASDPGRITSESPMLVYNPQNLTFNELLVRQQQHIGTLPRCRLVNESLKVMDVLQINPLDEVQDNLLLTPTIRVTRCQGFCAGFNRCLPTRTVNESFVVHYLDEHGVVQKAERQVQNHVQCLCQGV